MNFAKSNKVAYTAVLSIVPGLHAQPPQLPALKSEDLHDPTLNPAADLPSEGYDFIFHLGAGNNGSLALEQVGHKLGYNHPGVDGALAPIIATEAVLEAPSAAEQYEAERLRRGTDVTSEANGDSTDHGKPAATDPIRGFAKGYERFPDELCTEVDVYGLIEHLKQQGETRVNASTDAGHYMCDFIYYCSLAESQRPLIDSTAHEKKSRRSKSLFMHVPHEECQPHTVEELTEAVRQIVAWVCTKGRALPREPNA